MGTISVCAPIHCGTMRTGSVGDYTITEIRSVVLLECRYSTR